MKATETDKRPRHYAFEIIQLKTRAERQAALDATPVEWRPLIRKHVENYYNKRRALIDAAHAS